MVWRKELYGSATEPYSVLQALDGTSLLVFIATSGSKVVIELGADFVDATPNAALYDFHPRNSEFSRTMFRVVHLIDEELFT